MRDSDRDCNKLNKLNDYQIRDRGLRGVFEDLFGDQILGKVEGVHFEGYNKENDLELEFNDVDDLNWISSLDKLLNGRNFWVRVWPSTKWDDGVYLRIILE